MERNQFNPHDVRSESLAQRYLKSSIYYICCVSTYVSCAISTRFITVDSYENGEYDLTRRDK